nr:hypothetical protein [Sulfolobales archaeon]
MNKTLGLVLASLFLLSMVVGLVNVLPTQAANGNPSIVSIYNQMMNNQPVGWGRSLINVTVYNPYGTSTNAYVFQLNFTGPGPLTVNFLPAVQIFSADQLARLKPVVGWYEFTGSNNLYKFNYTIVILTTSPIQSLTEYWPTG